MGCGLPDGRGSAMKGYYRFLTLLVLLFAVGLSAVWKITGTGTILLEREESVPNFSYLKVTLATDSCSEGDFEKRGVSTHLPRSDV